MVKRKRGPVCLSLVATASTMAALLLSACSGASAYQAPLPAKTPIIYTTASTNVAGVTAVSGRDGTQLWHTEVGHSNWAPTLVGDVLFACTVSAQHPDAQVIVAVRVTDGHVLWRTPLPSEGFNYVISADASTVAVDAGSHGLYALDATTGHIRWHHDGRGAGRPIVRHGTVYALVQANPVDHPSGSAAVSAYSASDGTERWSISYAGQGRIVVNSEMVFGNDGPNLPAAARAEDGHLLWEDTSGGWVLAATDDMVLVNDTALTALDPKDGHVLWRSTVDFSLVSVGYDDLPVANGYIYGPLNHDVVALKASDGTQAWRASFGTYNVGGVFTQGTVVFALLVPPQPEFHFGPCLSACTTRLVALDGTTGQTYWQQDVPDAQLLPVRAQA